MLVVGIRHCVKWIKMSNLRFQHMHIFHGAITKALVMQKACNRLN